MKMKLKLVVVYTDLEFLTCINGSSRYQLKGRQLDVMYALDENKITNCYLLVNINA